MHDPELVPQHIAQLPSQHVHPPDQQLPLHDPGPMELLHHPPDPGKGGACEENQKLTTVNISMRTSNYATLSKF